jgi:cytochrome c biogenesis protein ResB
MFKKIFQVFKSLRFTVVIIICLTSLFLLGVIVPQKDLLGRDMYLSWKDANPVLVSFLEFLDLTDVYTSPLTLLLWGLFFLNLVTVIFRRIPSIWRRYTEKSIPQSIESIERSRNYETLQGHNMDSVKDVLTKGRYTFFSHENAFRGVKNRISPLATILFHLSFLLLLTGGVMTFYTEFRAEAPVAEGETFTGNYRWVRSPKIGSIPTTTFIVEKIKPSYYQEVIPAGLDVVIHTDRGKEVIGINKPFKRGSLSFIIKDIDVAPLFIIRNKKGEEVDGAIVKLKGLSSTLDSFTMQGYKFMTFFYSNYADQTTEEKREIGNLPQALQQSPMTGGSSQSREIIDPAFYIEIYEEGLLMNSGTVKPGESLEFEDYLLEFAELDYWVMFYVTKEHGLGILYTGFVIMILALIIRFLFYRRDIRGIIEDGSVHIAGRGEFFPVLFEDEFRKLIGNLKAKKI